MANEPYISFIEKVTPDTGSLGDTIIYHGLIVTSSLNPFLGFGYSRMEDQYQFWYLGILFSHDGYRFTASFTPTIERTYKISYITLTGASGSTFYGNTDFPSLKSTLIGPTVVPDPFADFPKILSIQKISSDSINVGDTISYTGIYTASVSNPITSTQFRLARRPRPEANWYYSSISWNGDNTFTSSFVTTDTGSYLLDYISIYTSTEQVDTDYTGDTVYYFNTVSSSGFDLDALNDTVVSEISPTPTPVSSPTPTTTPTPTSTETLTPTPSSTPTSTPTPTVTGTPTSTPAPTPTPSATNSFTPPTPTSPARTKSSWESRRICSPPIITKLGPYELKIEHGGIPSTNWNITWKVYRPLPVGGIVSTGSLDYTNRKGEKIIDMINEGNILYAECRSTRGTYRPNAVLRRYLQ
jgi:hypothetical protein